MTERFVSAAEMMRRVLGMPGYAEARPGSPDFVPLSDREVTDLVALLASWRGEK